jgi:hypothetical protein
LPAILAQLSNGFALETIPEAFPAVGKKAWSSSPTKMDSRPSINIRNRRGLYEKYRELITLSIRAVSAFPVGALIALYEQAVGFYGSLVNINAYHQPGVEAGTRIIAALAQDRFFLRQWRSFYLQEFREPKCRPR